MWTSYKVDSRTVTLTDKQSLSEKINFYGPDSNYVKSHILGEFPTASTEQLIPADWVAQAAVRETFTHPADAVVLGVDVASGHSEDSSCIVVRRGLDARSYPILRFPTLNPLELAYRAASLASEIGADAIFCDAGGLGEGCVARLQELGAPVHPIYGAGRPDNPSAIAGRAGNKRAEVWLKMREWLRAGSIPADATLMAELCAPEFSEGPAGILIERKKDMRARGLNSPDSADALSLTFSYPTFTQASGLVGQSDYRVAHEYDPFSDAALEGKPLPESRRRYTVPGYPLKPEWGGGLDNPADWANPDAGPGEWQ
jgi:hypothetical protein